MIKGVVCKCQNLYIAHYFYGMMIEQISRSVEVIFPLALHNASCEIDNADSFRFHKAMNFTEANRIICFTKTL